MRQTIYDSFFLITLLAILYGIGELLAPFAGTLLMAIVCAICFYPLYGGFHQSFPHWNASLRAAIAALFVLSFFIAPLTLLTWAVIAESTSLGTAFQRWRETLDLLRQGQVTGDLSWLQPVRVFLIRTMGISSGEFRNHLMDRMNRVFESIAFWGTELTKHSVMFLVDLLIITFILFFLFRDGPQIVKYIYDLVPLRAENKMAIRQRLQEATIGLARGWILTSFIQGITAMFGYFVVGTPGAVLLGVLTGAAGFIPLIGTSVIWIPVGLAFLLQGNTWKGLGILAWGAFVVVGMIDSMVRPYLVGRHTHLPLYALFFALVGGIEVWGAKGVILGPLLVSIAPVFLDMYHTRYLRNSEL